MIRYDQDTAGHEPQISMTSVIESWVRWIADSTEKAIEVHRELSLYLTLVTTNLSIHQCNISSTVLPVSYTPLPVISLGIGETSNAVPVRRNYLFICEDSHWHCDCDYALTLHSLGNLGFLYGLISLLYICFKVV